MKLFAGSVISELIEDPIKQTSLNINNTPAYFFHGTRKELLPLIRKEGFAVVPGRPVFSLDPIYSMGYSRKSESYLRRLINSGDKQALRKEIDDLISNKVITQKDLKDTKYMWWINKANDYYKKRSDITKEGILLAFPWKSGELEEAAESRITYRESKGKKYLEGAPSYWRTRQYFYKTEKPFNQTIYSEVKLNKRFVELTQGLYSTTGKGMLDMDKWAKVKSQIKSDLGESLKMSLLSQIVESRLLKELRDLLIGVLKNRGLKIYWKRNYTHLEDPRWTLSGSEIKEKIKSLVNNKYPYEEWETYVKNKLSVIKDLT